MNKVDVADMELLDLVEIEIAEMLEAHGYEAVFVRGSALLAHAACMAGRFDDAATSCIADARRGDGHRAKLNCGVASPKLKFETELERSCHTLNTATVAPFRAWRG